MFWFRVECSSSYDDESEENGKSHTNLTRMREMCLLLIYLKPSVPFNSIPFHSITWMRSCAPRRAARLRCAAADPRRSIARVCHTPHTPRSTRLLPGPREANGPQSTRTTPAVGPWCRRNLVPCGNGRDQNKLWLTEPNPKPTPA